MDMNRLLTMIARIAMAQLVRIGVRKGVDFAVRTFGKTQRPDAEQGADEAEISRRTRRAARLNRRLGR